MMDTKELRELLAAERHADGYARAGLIHRMLESLPALLDAADRVEELEAENQRLREVLSDHYHQHRCGCGHPACRQCGRDERAEEALSQPDEQAPLMIRCQVCEHHTPVVFEPEPAQREGE